MQTPTLEDIRQIVRQEVERLAAERGPQPSSQGNAPTDVAALLQQAIQRLSSQAQPAGQDATSDLQLSQELASNLKKLKQVIAETQEIARKIEEALGSEASSQQKGQQQGQGA